MKKIFAILFLCISFSLCADSTRDEEVTKHLDMANSFAHQGNTEAALSEIDQALAIDPNNARAYKTRTNVHYHMGNYQLALQDANQFVHLAPNAALPYVDRAIVYYTLGNIPAAKQDIDHALELQPESEFAKIVKDQIYSTDKPAKKAPFKTKK